MKPVFVKQLPIFFMNFFILTSILPSQEIVPLELHNKWVYRGYRTDDNWITDSMYVVKEIIGDTILSNHEYKIIKRQMLWDNGSIDSRIEFWRGNTVFFAIRGLGQDQTYYNSNYTQDTTWYWGDPDLDWFGSLRLQISIPVLWGDKVQAQYWKEDWWGHGPDGYIAHRTALYIGPIYEDYYDEGWINREEYGIIGAFINGSVYGDTTVMSYISIRDLNTSYLPNSLILEQNRPNPFNPITTIQYELPQRSDVQITIYDLLGRKVTALLSETQEAGYKSVTWNGINDQGKPVSAGVYLYQIQAGEFVQTKKMVLLK